MAYKLIIDKIPDSAFDWAEEPSTIITDDQGNRWFLAPDVSRVLGYTHYKKAIKHHVSPANIRRYGQIRASIVKIVSLTPTRIQDDWRFISEKGLYHFIDTSKRKAYARELKATYF